MNKGDQIRQAQRLSTLQGNVALVDLLLDRLKEDPTRFGVMGSVRGAVQGTAAITSDLAEVIKNSSGGMVDLNQTAANIAQSLKGSPIEDEMAGFFDPKLSDLDLLENTLAFELARLRLEKSKGEIRALTAAFRDAKKDVNLKGLTSSRDVEARLRSVREQFATELAEVSRIVTGKQADSGDAPPPPDRKTGAGDTVLDPDDLDAKLNDIFGGK